MSEGAVFKELKRKKGIVRNQGQLPGEGDGERVLHIEGAAEAKLEQVQELQAAGGQGRHLPAVHRHLPSRGTLELGIKGGSECMGLIGGREEGQMCPMGKMTEGCP